MDLYQRIISGIIFLPFLLWAILSESNIPFLLLLNSIVTLSLLEFYNIVERRFKAFRYPGILLGLLIIMTAPSKPSLILNGIVILLGVFLYIFSRLYGQGKRIGDLAMTVVGVVYLPWMLSHLVGLRDLPNGRYYLLMCFGVTWATDAGAYGIGTFLGRHKLIPRISPRKSVEGAIGGLIWAVLVSIILGVNLLQLSFSSSFLLGILLGVFAQVGDTIESIIKRDFGVKDSSNFVPGHGGVLDVFDSLVFTSPVMFYSIQYVR